MGWISGIFVHKAIDAAIRLGCVALETRACFFQSVGVDPEAPSDPNVMIPASDFFGLLEAIAKEGDQWRSVPIVMGASMRCDEYGAFGLAFKSAPDLLGSYSRVERFGKIVTSIANFGVQRSGNSVFMEVIPGQDHRPGLTMTNELAVAAAMSLSREVSTERFVPIAVHFMAAEPDDDEAYRAHFRCPIRYGAERDALEVTLAVASRPNRLSDDGMSKFFEGHLDQELSSMQDTAVLERRVLTQIGDALSEGVPTIAEVARRLGMSSRTLQRRLSDSGLAYQHLVGDARRTLAEKLLKRSDYALAEIAFLTGFSDQSTFTRAFKRWHGQTPASYRRGA